jgi:hypothetical protein
VHGYSLAFELGAAALLVSSGLVVFGLQAVSAVPRNAQAEVASQQAGVATAPTPASPDEARAHSRTGRRSAR